MARCAVLLAFLVAPAVARADDKADFANAMGIEAASVVEVQRFALRGGDYASALVGRYTNREHALAGAVLIWCGAKQCWATHAWLGPADEVETLGLVDLRGAPAPFPATSQRYARELKLAGRPKWPALLVRTTHREQMTTSSRYGGQVTGEHRYTELAVLSLSRKDERVPAVLRTLVDEHWPTGAGVHVTFAVERDGHIVATEQRDLERRSMCLRPKPTTIHYKLDEHRRFQRTADLAHHGCGSR